MQRGLRWELPVVWLELFDSGVEREPWQGRYPEYCDQAHPKVLAAEALASTSRLGQFGDLDTIGAAQALQHAERVLVAA
jgi:hypothetical protein